MTKLRFLVLLATVFACSCEFEEGNFDGSLFDDARIPDEDDAGDDDDAGRGPRDSGTRDSGTDSGPTDSGPSPSTLKPTDVPAVIARGRCKALETCMGKSLLLDGNQLNDCVEFSTKQLADRHLHWLPQSVDANRVTFRPEELDECERDIALLECDVQLRPLPASCERAVEGKAQEDGDCTIDQDCAGDLWCDKGEQETCPGRCARLQTAGLPCDSSAQCAAGLRCDANRVCNAPPAEGDECGDRMNPIECPAGLICQGTSGDLTCRNVETVYVSKLDEPCDALGQLCELGLVCQSTSNTSSAGVCKRTVGQGETCRRSEPNQCPVNQFCKANSGDGQAAPGAEGVCANRPTDGQSCASIGCAPGHWCVGGTTCKALKSAGGSCTDNAECYGRVCDADVDVCLITTIMCN